MNRDKLLQYSEQNYWTMVTGAAVIYTAVTALSIPLASGLSLMIGFLFGRWIGMIVILFSATLGATLAFLGARFVFAEAAQRRMGKVTRKIIAAFHENDFNYLLFLRLIPLFPFWLVNLACAFTLMKTRTYIMATAVGIAPGCFVLANLGQSLSRIDSTEKLYSLQTLGAWVLVGIFALLPAFIKKIRLSKAREAF
ncbi:MAG: TVP38/TMEM64 family protein [Thermodesulfobacteriota bacterium]